MKTLTTLLFLVIATVANCQSLPDLIREYEKHCNQIVKDTVTQYGNVEYENIPVKDTNGKIIHYVMQPTDTVWEKKPKCPEYKHVSAYSFGGTLSFDSISTIDWSYSPAITYTLQLPQIQVSRDYICTCKLREVEPFSEHFWNWIKNRKP